MSAPDPDDLPEPLTDFSLPGFRFMSLDLDWFIHTDAWLMAKGDDHRVIVEFWSIAWKQFPAASLPNDDLILFKFGSFGKKRDFVRAKERILRGWILASDDRWYQPELAEMAHRAFELHRKDSKYSKDYRERRRDTRNDRQADAAPDCADDAMNVSPDEHSDTASTIHNGNDRQGQRREEKIKESLKPSCVQVPRARERSLHTQRLRPGAAAAGRKQAASNEARDGQGLDPEAPDPADRPVDPEYAARKVAALERDFAIARRRERDQQREAAIERFARDGERERLQKEAALKINGKEHP
jgi:hypothetical protein